MDSNQCRELLLGCLYGVAIGDAVGGVLEFMPGRIGDVDVENALNLPGGGCHGLLPGQVTDDTELAVALARGLLSTKLHERNVAQKVNIGEQFPEKLWDEVALEYNRWYESEPFDIGFTCATAFSHSTPPTMKRHANISSQANGALMRCTPLIVWAECLGASGDQMARLLMEDAQLSHPNVVCQESSAVYGIAVRHLLRHPGDRCGAEKEALKWSDDNCSSEVRDWIQPGAVMTSPRGKQAGWVRHGLQMAFYHLRHTENYQDAIRETVQEGGDTDTNAAIVGGMLGACVGLAGLPETLVDGIMKAAVSSNNERLHYYHPGYFGHFVSQLLE